MPTMNVNPQFWWNQAVEPNRLFRLNPEDDVIALASINMNELDYEFISHGNPCDVMSKFKKLCPRYAHYEAFTFP
eukprot:10008880-Karenia_brevis.AAC.1